jgi:Flp pilus assembly CpaE family ATPase
MRDTVVFTSARSGTGVSTLARAFAVEAAHSLDTKIIDLDQGAGATSHWGQQRAAHGVTPIVPVVRLSPAQVCDVASSSELLVIDAPASFNGAEDWSNLWPVLTVVAVRESLDDLDRTMQCLRRLIESGLCKRHLAVGSAAYTAVAR